MATYIALIRWTQEGIENVKQSPDRLDAAKKAFQAMGAELKEFYLVMGRYDMVVVSEAPDDETVAKLALAIGSGGAIRTETLRAFSEEEYSEDHCCSALSSSLVHAAGKHRCASLESILPANRLPG